MKKIWMLSIAAVAAFTLGATSDARAQAKDWKKIRIATEGAYAPWNFQDASGKLAGFEIDLAADLCRRMGAECEVVAQDWDGIIPALNAGKYDAIMAGMNVTPRRMEVISFSTPYAAGPHAFVTTKSSPLAKIAAGATYSLTTQRDAAVKEIETLKTALKGKTVGVQVSTTNGAFLDAFFKGVVDVKEYKTTEQHDLDLTAGRIDAAIAAVSYWSTVLEKPEGKDLVVMGPAFVGDVLGLGVGIGVRKGDPELRAKFDGAVKAAIADGTTKTMSMKWFKVDMTPK
jgi:octopine/nopaline transport system substrate-binding protein